MKTKILIFLILFVSTQSYSQNLPKVVSGSIKRIENFKSEFIAARNVDIWLPEGYSTAKKYAVLYMHDGQMLFDSTTTWNHQSWDVDDVASGLMREGKIQDLIVVGIWNIPNSRIADYSPQKPLESLTQEQKDLLSKQFQKAGMKIEDFKPNSDNYLKFLVKELKPFIDKNYSTYEDRKHTFIAGSSMGGLISIYAICEYPDVFGGAACMSSHWPVLLFSDDYRVPDGLNYLSSRLPDPGTHKIYFDYGDQTLDAIYPPYQKKVDEVMKARGFSALNWITKFYPGKDHSEKSWKERLNVPMEFLLKK